MRSVSTRCCYFRMAAEDEKGSKRPKDLRRYCCKTCGITRSRRILLKLHIISIHRREALENDERFASETEGQSHRRSPCVCQDCGASFNKPAHLEQHKLSHTGEVGYTTNPKIYPDLWLHLYLVSEIGAGESETVTNIYICKTFLIGFNYFR